MHSLCIGVRVCCFDDLFKDEIVPRKFEEGNRGKLCVLRDACFCMEFGGRVVERDEGLGRQRYGLTMGAFLRFLGGVHSKRLSGMFG